MSPQPDWKVINMAPGKRERSAPWVCEVLCSATLNLTPLMILFFSRREMSLPHGWIVPPGLQRTFWNIMSFQPHIKPLRGRKGRKRRNSQELRELKEERLFLAERPHWGGGIWDGPWWKHGTAEDSLPSGGHIVGEGPEVWKHGVSLQLGEKASLAGAQTAWRRTTGSQAG